MEKTYIIDGTEYELYLAASGDYCVTICNPFEEDESYRLGSLENALNFILAKYEY